MEIGRGIGDVNDQDCSATDYDNVVGTGGHWPGTALSHAVTGGSYKGSTVSGAGGGSAACTYTSWLMVHGSHNYSREVRTMPLYRDFNYAGPLKDISCSPMMCAITVPLLEQFGWIYSDKVRTTCILPDLGDEDCNGG
jgi:hypothetical protein